MPRARSTAALVALGIVALLLFAGLVALGSWQVERRSWKHDLIARVDARLAAASVAAPGPADWARVTTARDEYRRVAARGRFLHDRTTLVQAVTALDGGWWVMTPLITDRGFTVLVNRGFVPTGTDFSRPSGLVGVTGLLRISEPGGGFLRTNDPVAGRWYSRDVAAITRGLTPPAAPYFIDAARGRDRYPVGGLTVVAFADNHLVYAITWYALAMMVLVAAVVAIRQPRARP